MDPAGLELDDHASVRVPRGKEEARTCGPCRYQLGRGAAAVGHRNASDPQDRPVTAQRAALLEGAFEPYRPGDAIRSKSEDQARRRSLLHTEVAAEERV